jgi:hypothetical protein
MLLVAGCSAPRGDQQIADGSATTSAFTEVWYAPDGDPAEHGEGRDRTFEVTARVGADHCDWQSVVFLSVAWPLGSTYQAGADAVPFRQYVRDREGRVSGPLMGDLELTHDCRMTLSPRATGRNASNCGWDRTEATTTCTCGPTAASSGGHARASRSAANSTELISPREDLLRAALQAHRPGGAHPDRGSR